MTEPDDVIAMPQNICIACGAEQILSVGDIYMCPERYLSDHGSERKQAIVDEMFRLREAPTIWARLKGDGYIPNSRELLKQALENLK